MASPSRPWQGTALGVIDIIGVVFMFIFAILFLFLQNMIGGILQGASAPLSFAPVQTVIAQEATTSIPTDEALKGLTNSLNNQLSPEATKAAAVGVFGVLGMLQGIGTFVGILFIAFGILSIFMARGAFKGQKWSPILSIILGILGILSVLGSMSSPLFSWSNSIVPLVLDIFIVYCGVICVKDPFYNKKA